MTDIIHRNAVRAILLTPDSEVLLLRIRLDGVAPFWIAPGGGIEVDEQPLTALARELKEEVGLEIAEAGGVLWRRQHTFNFRNKRYCQMEHYYAVPTPRFCPRMDDTAEAVVVDEFRWWTLSEMHDATERLTPLSLANIVESYLRDGPPKQLPKVEILVD